MFTTEIKRDGSNCTILLNGQISFKNAIELKDTIIKEGEKGHKHVVLQFGDDVYLDSSGIGAIFNSQKYLKSIGGDLKLKNVSKDVMTILRIANLDKHLDIIP